MSKGSVRKVMKKYSKGSSSGNRKGGVPRNNLSSKVANVLLGEGRNSQSSSYGAEDIGSNSDTFTPLKRKYTFLNDIKNHKSKSSVCILCQDVCESNVSIQCSVCKRYYHGNCIHLSERDLQLHQLCNISHVCLICIVKDIPHANGVIDIVEVLDEKCEEFELTNKSFHSVTDKLGVNESSVSETDELETNNTIVDQLLLEQDQLSTPIHPKEKSGDNNIVSLVDVGISILKDDKTVSQEIDFVAEEGEALVDPENNNSNREATGGKVEEVHTSDNTKTEGASLAPLNNYNNSSNLVIIDNIKESWKYKSSSNIKREFSKYFRDVKLILAYSLKAGGIALHLASRESAERVLRFLWPAEAFGGSGTQLYCHTTSNKPKVILKNIDTSVSEKEVEDLVHMLVHEKVSVKRFHFRDTGKRLAVVKVTCSETASDSLLSNSLNILGRDIIIEKFENIHRREITCFNCREKGHIARSCPQLTSSLLLTE